MLVLCRHVMPSGTSQHRMNTGCQCHAFRFPRLQNHSLNLKVSVLFTNHQLWYQLQEQRWGETMSYSIFLNLSRRTLFFRFWSLLPCIKPEATDVFCLTHSTGAQIALKTNKTGVSCQLSEIIKLVENVGSWLLRENQNAYCC